MLLSVVIPTCNRNDLLQLCLNGLSPASQTIQEPFEVIVTDDSPANNAKRLIQDQFAWVKWIEGPRKGPAANRNNGGKQAQGQWLVFIDDDCLPDVHILNNYRAAITSNLSDEAFEGMIVPDDWDLMKKDLAECPVNTVGNCFWSANVCIKASLFKTINGFDESYLIAAQEDQQMKINIESATGKAIRFLKECVVVHPVRFTTVQKQINRIPLASKNFSLYAFKNRKLLGHPSFLQFSLAQFKIHARNTMHEIKRRRGRSAVVSLIYLLYAVPLNMINYYSLRRSGKY